HSFPTRRSSDLTAETNTLQAAILVESPLHAQHRVEFDERQGGTRIVQIDSSFFDPLDEIRRKRVHINFQANRQCCFRTDARTDTAELIALNRLMKLELASPISFITERVVTKYLPPFLDRKSVV